MTLVKTQQAGWDRTGSTLYRSSLLNFALLLNRFTICLTAIQQSASRNPTGFASDKQRFNTCGARTGPGFELI